jgi:hypothetical protein
MTVSTRTSFEVETFKRAYEEWDVETLLDLYSDELELTQVYRDNPPSSPRSLHGKEVLRGMLVPRRAQGPGQRHPGGRGWPHRPRARRPVGRPEAVRR